jgi:iron complex outermembrane receptor protein
MALCLASTPAAAQQQMRDFNIPAGDLGTALNAFARQASQQIMFSTSLVSGKRSAGLAGRYEPRGALKTLLDGSGLEVASDTGAVVTLRRAVPAASAEATQPEVADLAELIVTAQKREQRLQDVPMAVTAIPQSRIERLHAMDFKDLIRYIPGVSYSGEEHGQSRYNIRGVSTAANNPTVGVYLDDVSLVSVATGFSGSADPVFFDFERLEVLKGPQGTLYGGNAMGGAIKYVSRRPELNRDSFTMGGGVAATAKGDPSYDLQGTFNLGVVENVLAVRGGLLYRQRGGYIDNVANAPITNWAASQTNPPAPFEPQTRPSLSTLSKKNGNEARVWVGRLSALWTPDPTITITPSLFVQAYSSDNTNVFLTNLPEFQSSNRISEPSGDRLNVGSLTITKDFGPVTLTSLTGYMHRVVKFDRDYSFFIGRLVPPLFPLLSPNSSDSTTTNYSQEFRLASNPSDSPLRWTVGLFASKQNDRLVQKVVTVGGGALFGLTSDTLYYGNIPTVSKEFAVFGEATYTVAEKLDLTLGLRQFFFQQDIDAVYSGPLNGGPSSVSGVTQKESGLNPKVSVAYRITEENLAYATASKGFRQGGANRNAFSRSLCQTDLDRLGITDQPQTYRSDSIWTYEGGTKNRFADGAVTLNGSAYFTQWKGIQQSQFLPSCGFVFIDNVGEAEVRGAELEAQFVPVKGLSFFGAAAYTDTNITQTRAGVSAQVGQNVLDVPRWAASFGASYSFPLADEWIATLDADYQYHGSNLRTFDSSFTTQNPNGTQSTFPNPIQRQKAYHVSNASVTIDKDRWQYRLYIANLFDSSPYLDRAVINAAAATTIRPRTVGVDAKVRF